MSDAQFVVIDGIHDAKNLIYATWLRCYEANSLAAKHIPKDTFFAEHHKVLDRIFARDPIVKLAVLPDDPSVVLGWAVYEPELAHFVYIKPAFRRYRIATALLQDLQHPFTYTHWTHILRDLRSHLDGCNYNPYRA